MSYTPSPIPQSVARELAAFLRGELRRIEVAFMRLDNLKLAPLAAEPTRYSDGMVVYADGTNWNPGSGAGFYGREGGAWVKL